MRKGKEGSKGRTEGGRRERRLVEREEIMRRGGKPRKGGEANEKEGGEGRRREGERGVEK